VRFRAPLHRTKIKLNSSKEGKPNLKRVKVSNLKIDGPEITVVEFINLCKRE
jgi:hypothetical protein